MKQARNRRHGSDRRQADVARKGLPERRRRAERRSIGVEEVPFEAWAEAASEARERAALAPRKQLRARRGVPHRFVTRAKSDRRREDRGPPAGRAERRSGRERRALVVREISYGEFLKALRQRG